MLKKKLKQVMVPKKIEYGEDFKKINFKSSDDFSLNKPIKLRLLRIAIRSFLVKMVNFILNYF